MLSGFNEEVYFSGVSGGVGGNTPVSCLVLMRDLINVTLELRVVP